MISYQLRNHPHIKIKLKPNKRSRRITLRVSARDGGLTLSHPPRIRQGEVERFIEEHEGWILRHYRPGKPIEIGMKLPYRGGEVEIAAGEKRGVRVENGRLLVKSTSPARAIAGFFKTEAALYAAPKLDHYAERLGKSVAGLRWRDPKTRWGSCDSRGIIMLSWRLIMAPDWIFDYVIAHEAAHLAHMDHSPRYWRQLAEIYPECDQARSWLRREGKELQAIQF